MTHRTQALTPSLPSDCRGAVMIMAVFMAMIAIGALYFLVGLGDAMLAQERMQDAADATAFSSAVIHARGMNILALINIIMAAVLAILVLLSILATILKTGTAAVAIAALFIPGAGAVAAGLNSAAKTVQAAENRAKPFAEKVLEAGHRLQGPIARAIPVIAGLNAYTLSSQSYGPVVSGGTTFPIVSRLPTVDGKFDTLCTKAGEYAGEAAVFPIKAVGVPDFIADELEDMAKTAAVAYAKYYCGKGKMPKLPSISVKVSLPELDSDERATCEGENPGDSCEKYAELKRVVAKAYQVESGICEHKPEHIDAGAPAINHSKGQIENFCLQVRRTARSECLPSRKIKETTWVTRKVEHYYRIVGEGEKKRVVPDTREAPDGIKRGDGEKQVTKNYGAGSYSDPYGTGTSVPCKIAGTTSTKPAQLLNNFTEWNFDPNEPLCTEDFDTPTIEDFGSSDTLSISVTEVADIISCESKKKLKSKLSGEPVKEDMKKNTPQEMCNCAALGEDMFQIRSVVFGDAKEYTAKSDSRILVATLGKEAPSTTIGQIASVVGRMAAAQAEYYFEWDDPDVQSNPNEWLWHMGWKARMRRLRLSGKAWECPEKKNTCESTTGDLGKLALDQAERVSALTTMLKEGADGIIVH